MWYIYGRIKQIYLLHGFQLQTDGRTGKKGHPCRESSSVVQ